MPFVIASLPSFGLGFLADPAAHQWMAVICFIIAMVAFVPGWRKHRRLLPIGFGFVGLTLIGSAAFGAEDDCCASALAVAGEEESLPCCVEACCQNPSSQSFENLGETSVTASADSLITRLAPWLTPVGGLVLVTAHLLNRRFGCACGCCEVKPSDESVHESV